MALPDFIRAKIFEMIQNKVKYPEIINWVKGKGYSISKGGITYLKENYPKELAKEKTEQTEQKTEQLNIKKKEKNLPGDQEEKSDYSTKMKFFNTPEIFQFSKAFWIAWDDILPSLESVFKQSKWKSKFNMIQILKNEIENLRSKN